MKKNIQMHNESIHKKKVDTPKDGEALPAYLLDRENVTRAKVLSNSLKQKRKEKAGKWTVPLPRVKPIRFHGFFISFISFSSLFNSPLLPAVKMRCFEWSKRESAKRSSGSAW